MLILFKIIFKIMMIMRMMMMMMIVRKITILLTSDSRTWLYPRMNSK